ncbi:SAM-dependent methyltransferase [Nemorincola caseinilytica]|uniref:SAM-dependent methyltransferase n=1 Tax=Nemorincola caseinilytica TaxID=2054315 RepID=A0ABP8N8V6_9BACT
MTAPRSTIYMVPLPVAEGANHTLSPDVARYTTGIRHYFVENIRTARRFLRSLHATLVIDDIHFSEIDKHNGPDTALLRTWLKQGVDIGIMSEAGCPGVADPGSALVAIAHTMGAKVVPLTGPSSLLLALMASGLNGQSFAFNGYLPVKEPARSKAIKDLEARSQREKQTQLFIETPYRNNPLLQDLLRTCAPGTRICIAMNVTAADEYISTRTVAEWKKDTPALEKAPAVFLLLA